MALNRPVESPQAVRELEVLEIVSAWLGYPIVDRPESEETKYPGLNTEAVMARPAAGDVWAVDVATLADDLTMYQTAKSADEALTRLAEAHDVLITLWLEEQVSVKRDVMPALTLIVSQSQVGCCDVGTWLADWRPAKPGVAAVNVAAEAMMHPAEPPAEPTSPYRQAGADIAGQVTATLQRVLVKKRKQQDRAHSLGLRYCLILDLRGHVDVKQGTHRLPQSPITVQYGVWQATQAARFTPDAVLLVWRDDTPLAVAGTFGDHTFDLSSDFTP